MDSDKPVTKNIQSEKSTVLITTIKDIQHSIEPIRVQSQNGLRAMLDSLDKARAVPFDELPLIDWECASETVGGGEPDDAFLMDLLVSLYEEEIPTVTDLLNLIEEYKKSKILTTKCEGQELSVEQRFKMLTHRVKGAASNVRVWRLAIAAEAFEWPFKDMMPQLESETCMPVEERHEIIQKATLAPDGVAKRFFQEFDKATDFIRNNALSRVDPQFKDDIEPETLESLKSITETKSYERWLQIIS